MAALKRPAERLARSAWRSACSALGVSASTSAKPMLAGRVHDPIADVDAAGGDHPGQALGDDRQALLVGMGQQHGELVAAEPCDEVGFAQPAGQRSCDRAQRLIAGVAAVDAVRAQRKPSRSITIRPAASP